MSYLKVFCATMTVLVLFSGLSLIAEEDKQPHDLDMKQKLEFSKLILDGLVTEDFDKIYKGATSLNELGKRKWLEHESSEYRTQNQVFWFTAGTLAIAAEKKNIDGAALA